MNSSILKLARTEASKSTHHFRVGAVIFKKKIIISSGHNYKSKSVKHHHPIFRKRKNSVHAEVDAIIRAKVNLKGCSLLVVRLSAYDKLALSKPCAHCMTYIEHVGIKNVYYSITDDIERIKI
jgi:deoxycytidylate deaminase